MYLCNVCNFPLCNDCWDLQIPHKRNLLGPGSVPHEKTDPYIARTIQKVLSPPKNEGVREQMYQDDEDTAWFGVCFHVNTFCNRTLNPALLFLALLRLEIR